MKATKIIMAAAAVWLMTAASACSKSQAAAPDNNIEDMTDINTNQTPDTTSAKVEVETTMGNFTILLYGDTPKHRDNFVKLVNEGYYDGTLFHRIINEFMVQAGDPESKKAAPGQRLGAGGPGYTIEAEILFPKHFHKRYTLAAARQGDQVNPEKRSSGSQFYVVTGQKVPESQIARLEENLHNQQLQSTFNGLAAEHMDEIHSLQAAGNQQGLRDLQQQLIAQTEEIVAKNPLKLTDEMREAYTTVGGAPHLDGAYTVFGEVISGMDVIDKIEKVETDRSDRPTEDIRIIKMKVLAE